MAAPTATTAAPATAAAVSLMLAGQQPLSPLATGDSAFGGDVSQRLKRRLNNDRFMKLFDLPPTTDDELLYDCLCSLMKKTSKVHGRLYVSKSLLCYHSDASGLSTRLVVPLNEITAIRKLPTHNELEMVRKVLDKKTDTLVERQTVFASFVNLDKTLARITSIWEAVNGNKHPSLPGSLVAASSASPSPSLPSASTSTTSLPTSTGPATSSPSVAGDEGLLLLEDEGNNEAVDGFLHREQKGTECLRTDFPGLTPLQWFATFWGDTESCREFMTYIHNERGDTEVNDGHWKAHEQFGKIRERTFRIPLNLTIGPSSSRVEETVRCALSRNTIVIESVAYSLDVPYADYFRPEVLWVAEPNPSIAGCTLVVSAKIRWLKKTMMKGMVESTFQKENKKDVVKWSLMAMDHLRTSSNLPVAPLANISASTSVLPMVDPSALMNQPQTSDSTNRPITTEVILTPRAQNLRRSSEASKKRPQQQSSSVCPIMTSAVTSSTHWSWADLIKIGLWVLAFIYLFYRLVSVENKLSSIAKQ